MKTIIAAIAIFISLIGFSEQAEARNFYHPIGHSTTYKSGVNSYGTPIYTKRIITGYDRYRRPIYKYYTLPINKATGGFYSGAHFVPGFHHKSSFIHNSRFRSFNRSGISSRSRFGSSRFNNSFRGNRSSFRGGSRFSGNRSFRGNRSSFRGGGRFSGRSRR